MNTKPNKNARKQPQKGWNRASANESAKQRTLSEKTTTENAKFAGKARLSELPGCAALVTLAKQKQQEVTGNG